jgi:hypothetical protein
VLYAFVGSGSPVRAKSNQRHTRTVDRYVVPDAMDLDGFPSRPDKRSDFVPRLEEIGNMMASIWMLWLRIR